MGRGEFFEFMFAHGSSMHQKCSNYALINLLFDLYRSLWVIDGCHFLKPNPGASAHPSTPKVLQAKECAPTPYSSVVFTLDSHLSLSRGLVVCQWWIGKLVALLPSYAWCHLPCIQLSSSFDRLREPHFFIIWHCKPKATSHAGKSPLAYTLPSSGWG
jgi:hypothetical protein